MGRKAERKQPRFGPEAYSDEWWRMRANCFGASEAAAVCGVSRWDQPLGVYAKKSGSINEAKGDQDNEAFERGHRFEPTTLKWYHDKLGGSMVRPPLLIHPEHDFMVATPDALWAQTEIGSLPWSYNLDYIPVDAKTTLHKGDFGSEGTDDIPQEYVMQAQQQMAVTDAERCDLPVLFRDFTFRLYTVRRNDDLIKLILEGEREMMDRLLNNDPPDPDWTHPKTYNIIKEIHNVVNDDAVELCEHATERWFEIEDMQEQVRELNKSIKSEKARVLNDMGDAGMGLLQDGRVLVRKKIKREAHEVKASEYVTLRCKKVS